MENNCDHIELASPIPFRVPIFKCQLLRSAFLVRCFQHELGDVVQVLGGAEEPRRGTNGANEVMHECFLAVCLNSGTKFQADFPHREHSRVAIHDVEHLFDQICQMWNDE